MLLVQAASPPPVQAASPSIPLLSLLDLAPLLKLLPLLRPCSVGQPLHLLGRPMPRGLSTSSTCPKLQVQDLQRRRGRT